MKSNRYSLIKLHLSRQIFEKYKIIKFHENPSRGSPVVPRWRTDRRANITKLIVVFLQFYEEV